MNDNAPTHLTHKPIISVNNYHKIDAQYINNTDAKALSVGFSTYNKTELSAKVWRFDNKNKKWKRQSEELPLHRALDLTTLIIASFIKETESNFPITNLGEIFNDNDTANSKSIRKFYIDNREKLKPRIDELERLIKEFRKNENKLNRHL